jgi:fatty acid desaturase
MTWWQAGIFLAVQHILNGLHIGLVFAPNHKGMPLLNEIDADDFLTQQVVTTRNVKHFPLATCLVGGLHFQIEHHLFTNMPRNKLRAARKLIKPYCDEKGIPYVETGLIESYVRVSSSFTEVAKA